MFYTVYKITNKINDKIYIGAHKTSDLEDGYMGSGNIIKRAIKKYGLENFEKEILEVFTSSQEMFEMESKLVTQDFIIEDTNYNLKEGGQGGFDYINNMVNTIENKILASLRTKAFYDANPIDKELKTLLLRENTTFESCSKGGNNSFGFKGKTHSDETKKKMSDKAKVHAKGEKNSQFGSMWIHNLQLKVSKKIKKEELQTYEDLGWIKGRKMKFM